MGCVVRYIRKLIECTHTYILTHTTARGLPSHPLASHAYLRTTHEPHGVALVGGWYSETKEKF